MKVFIVKEKNGNSIYNASTNEALYANALWHLENTTLAYMENDGTPLKKVQEAESAIREKDGRRAWSILQSRTHHEYEEVSLEGVFDVLNQK
jgi:hypothetical protein